MIDFHCFPTHFLARVMWLLKKKTVLRECWTDDQSFISQCVNRVLSYSPLLLLSMVLSLLCFKATLLRLLLAIMAQRKWQQCCCHRCLRALRSLHLWYCLLPKSTIRQKASVLTRLFLKKEISKTSDKSGFAWYPYSRVGIYLCFKGKRFSLLSKKSTQKPKIG